MTRDDFRIRKTGDGFRVWQRIGNSWEKQLHTLHPTREDARAWIAGVLAAAAATARTGAGNMAGP